MNINLECKLPTNGEMIHYSTYTCAPATGKLLNADYSNSTPNIACAYNRLGQQTTATDAVGSGTFAYNDKFQLTSKAISGIIEKQY